jgi:uncharacterized protein (TIGR00369 family)
MDQSDFMRATGLTMDTVEPSRVVGHLDLGPAHHTPWGIVHGGIYSSAIETAASTGASRAVADRGMFAVGMTNTTQFLRPVTGGTVALEAVAVHQGRSQQLWEAEVRDETGRLVARGEVRLQNIADSGHEPPEV